MISIIDPDVASHILRPTVYRAADTQVEASGRPREPQRKSVDSNREEPPDIATRLLTART